jgi:2-C-methyl-D-erythritol 4-phosphate cytidylyltransferase
LIDAVIAVARQGHGAVPALPMTDTVKESDRDEGVLRIVRTLPRRRLWRAQTPQGFPRPMLEAAYAAARDGGATATDDAGLVERLGQEVRLVPGSSRNVKVTTEEDFRLLEQLL